MAHKRYKASQERTPWSRLKPREEAILDRGFYHVQSVPYKVSLRWIFYRLYQEGFYKDKADYKNRFTKLFSRARHTFFKEWRPDTLEDETRKVIKRLYGCADLDAAAEEMAGNILDAARVYLDHFYRQPNYIELWFEARAMAGQFEHFTRDIDLIPMGGTASIPYKWTIAKRLEAAAEKYGKPIIILYFGDFDPAGRVIQEVIEKDVRTWTRAEFSLIWCGLTEGQVKRYEIPISIEGKGYQWEALSHEAAGEIIGEAVSKYVREDIMDEVDAEAEEFEESWRDRLEAVLEELRK